MSRDPGDIGSWWRDRVAKEPDGTLGLPSPARGDGEAEVSQTMEARKARIRARLAEIQASQSAQAQSLSTPPRYDEVYIEGVAALDGEHGLTPDFGLEAEDWSQAPLYEADVAIDPRLSTHDAMSLRFHPEDGTALGEVDPAPRAPSIPDEDDGRYRREFTSEAPIGLMVRYLIQLLTSFFQFAKFLFSLAGMVR